MEVAATITWTWPWLSLFQLASSSFIPLLLTCFQYRLTFHDPYPRYCANLRWPCHELVTEQSEMWRGYKQGHHLELQLATSLAPDRQCNRQRTEMMYGPSWLTFRMTPYLPWQTMGRQDIEINVAINKQSPLNQQSIYHRLILPKPFKGIYRSPQLEWPNEATYYWYSIRRSSRHTNLKAAERQVKSCIL